MQHPTHPDDERLAALAGGDPEATRDAGLRAHVDACDRCGPMVAELGQLRLALAQLPDLVPSRPIQLIPPVPAAVEQPSGGWLRRLAGPMVAAGMGMVLVGAIGTSGVLNSFGGLGAAAAPSAASEFTGGGVKSSAGEQDTGASAPESARESGNGAYQPGANGSPRLNSFGHSPSASPAAPVPSSEPAFERGNGSVTFGPLQDAGVSPWAVVLLVGVLLAVAGGTILVSQRGSG